MIESKECDMSKVFPQFFSRMRSQRSRKLCLYLWIKSMIFAISHDNLTAVITAFDWMVLACYM